MQRIAHLAAVVAIFSCGVAHAQERKTNIVVIWGDDIGQSNVSVKDYPQRQKAEAFSLDEELKKLQDSGAASK